MIVDAGARGANSLLVLWYGERDYLCIHSVWRGIEVVLDGRQGKFGVSRRIAPIAKKMFGGGMHGP